METTQENPQSCVLRKETQGRIKALLEPSSKVTVCMFTCIEYWHNHKDQFSQTRWQE